MLTVILTIDPKTLRGLFDNESRTLGTFNSMREAEDTLGDMLNYCTIRYARQYI